MSEEFYKLILDEVRSTRSRVDELKDFVEEKIQKSEDRMSDQIQKSENRMSAKMDRVEDECGRLEQAQSAASIEHSRMNALLDEHIRGVRLAEKRLEKLEDERIPILEQDLRERLFLSESQKKSDNLITRKAKMAAAVIGIPTALVTLVSAVTKWLGLW